MSEFPEQKLRKVADLEEQKKQGTHEINQDARSSDEEENYNEFDNIGSPTRPGYQIRSKTD